MFAAIHPLNFEFIEVGQLLILFFLFIQLFCEVTLAFAAGPGFGAFFAEVCGNVLPVAIKRNHNTKGTKRLKRKNEQEHYRDDQFQATNIGLKTL